MSSELGVLIAAAFSIGFFHTLIGPDHYLPFIMLSRAQKWTWIKTLVVTMLCGAGHVLSSIVIGSIGIGTGIALSRIEAFEGLRGNAASYLLFGFGVAYTAWGIKKAVKSSKHTHPHAHMDGSSHEHSHGHGDEHTHLHREKGTTVWWLFIIFLLGPCEPLIPILMYPAAKASIFGTVVVAGVFSVATIATMTTIVMLAHFGIRQIRFTFLDRYVHALGGAVIAFSGAAMIFLGM